MEEQKKRLEQELRFLKESLEADVISNDEYERGKERIENKLKEIESEEPQKEDIEIKEIKEEPTKIIGAEAPKEEPNEEKTEEQPQQEFAQEEEKTEESIKKEETKTETESSKEKEQTTDYKDEPEEEKSSKWGYIIPILILVAILFFSFKGCNNESPIDEISPPEENEEVITPECSKDTDCKQEGMIGTCSSPGDKEAKCEFKEDITISLLVINDKNCKLCDSSRMKKVLKELFPNIKIEEIDSQTEKAKTLSKELDIDALPAYILDSNTNQAANFNSFKRALTKKDNKYLVSNTASGAPYYLKRQEIKNKLEVFLTTDTEEEVDNNLNDFLTLFTEIDFKKNLVSEKQKELLSKELGITAYPSFVINNQLKFSGFHSANSIKEKFCSLNPLNECKKELKKSMV